MSALAIVLLEDLEHHKTFETISPISVQHRFNMHILNLYLEDKRGLINNVQVGIIGNLIRKLSDELSRPWPHSCGRLLFKSQTISREDILFVTFKEYIFKHSKFNKMIFILSRTKKFYFKPSHEKYLEIKI